MAIDQFKTEEKLQTGFMVKAFRHTHDVGSFDPLAEFDNQSSFGI